MNLNYLYDVINNEKIQLYDKYIDNCKGAFIKIFNINAIVLNSKNIENTKDKKCVLAEEMRSLLYGRYIFFIL